MDESLFTRCRLNEFTALRNASQQHLYRSAQRESQPVNTTGVWQPGWVRSLDSFRSLEHVVQTKLENLLDQQRQVFRTRFGTSDEEEARMHGNIETSSSEINKLLRELERLVHTSMTPKDPTSMDEAAIVSNAKKHLSSRLRDLVKSFTNTQELYTSHLKEREAKMKKFMRIGSAEAHEAVDREAKIAEYLKKGFTQDDIGELLLEESKYEQVSAEIKDTLERIEELNSMFQHLNSLVVEQGSMLDRIDFNLEAASVATARGLKQLEKASEYQSSCTVL